MPSKKTWKAPSAWPNSVLTFYSQKEKERERKRKEKEKKLFLCVQDFNSMHTEPGRRD
jgi:hypothetical protein